MRLSSLLAQFILFLNISNFKVWRLLYTVVHIPSTGLRLSSLIILKICFLPRMPQAHRPSCCSVTLVQARDQQVRLIDVPGLFEPNDKETRFNAEKINSALSLGFNYRLYFVLKADNRGPDDKEMVMMSRISECVRKSDGSQMSFGVIVNQIPSEEVGDMYNDLAKDNFRSMFDGLSIPGFTFDINIDSVIMLPFDELGLGQLEFQDKLADQIDIRPASASVVKRVKDISFCNNDLKLYQARHLSSGSGAVSIFGDPSEPPTLSHMPARGGAFQCCPPRNQLPESSNASVPNSKKSILAGYFVNLWNTTISPSHHNSGKSYSPSSHHNPGTSYSPSSHHNTGITDSSSTHLNMGISSGSGSEHNTEMTESSVRHHNLGVSGGSTTHYNSGMSGNSRGVYSTEIPLYASVPEREYRTTAKTPAENYIYRQQDAVILRESKPVHEC
ncbi:MAG: hypothetical protein BYD32DRAFT_77366 [Podila humilis]|nr:MAG: hypothetical protein BYD32DRAFT_77366 [Podila humilis]